MIADTNDALGGGGSLVRQIQQIAVNGISRAVDGALSRKYGLGTFNETQTVNAEGKLRPSDAAAKPPSAADAFMGFIQSSGFIMVAVAVAASLALFVALRK